MAEPGRTGSTVRTKPRLVLFFTRGMSLERWQRGGLLEREVPLYHKLRQRGLGIDFVTYGGPEDLALSHRIKGINVLCNRWRLHHRLYRLFLPLLHARSLRRATVLKSNQTDGAEIALRAARLWSKPLVARSGYPFSAFTSALGGSDSTWTGRARAIEDRVWSAAWRVVVTTQPMALEVARRIENGAAKTRIVPNYVESDRFRPGPERVTPESEIVFIGRLSIQKNLRTLLEAVRSLDCRLKVIGDGELGEELRQEFIDLQDRIEWIPRVPHAELPGHLQKALVFCLPSRFEGHPKALIEAMAAGLAVVGTDVPGIREVIQDGVTGLLSPAEPEALGRTIKKLLDDRELRTGLGRAAREFAMANFDLHRVVALEAEVYRDLEA